MATNPYFSSQFSTDSGLDGSLYQDLIDEAIQIKGRDFYYLPRTLENFDSFFGEDRLPSSFNGAAVVEMYMENVESWQGEGNILMKFGLEIRDQATLIVSKRRFMQEVTSIFPNVGRPNEGDILIFPDPYDRRLRAFEISFTNNESVFYQLGQLPVYKLTVKNFEYSGETFKTGVQEIDDYQSDWGLTSTIILTTGTGEYSPAEKVVAISWSADVVSYDHPELVVTNVVGELIEGDIIRGEDSGAEYRYQLNQNRIGNDSNMNDNEFIFTSEVEDDSEYNPFSGQ